MKLSASGALLYENIKKEPLSNLFATFAQVQPGAADRPSELKTKCDDLTHVIGCEKKALFFLPDGALDYCKTFLRQTQNY